MIKVTIQFFSNGELLKRTAILSANLERLSSSKFNQATGIIEFKDDSFWTIVFHENERCLYEANFELDDGSRTLKPITVITWTDDYIDDVQPVEQIQIKNV